MYETAKIWSEETLEFFGKLLLEEFGQYDIKEWRSFAPKNLESKEENKSWDYIHGEITRFNKKKGLAIPNSLSAVKNIFRWAVGTSKSSFVTMPFMCAYANKIAKAYIKAGFFKQEELDRITNMSFEVLVELGKQRERRKKIINKLLVTIRLRALNDPSFEKWIEELQELAK